jgi:23S rRNA (cytidine1920-2'-O)/16S rRNA (cytidine1409-2'-O)-methyltransferase
MADKKDQTEHKAPEPLWELLIDLGLADSKSQAVGLVMAGQVVVGDQRVDKPNTKVSPRLSIRVKGQELFVSRAGLKLFRWAEQTGRLGVFENASVLDIGSSTGGFTDVALTRRCKSVCCVDVGTNQLAWKLRSDERVEVFEKTDIRDFKPAGRAFDLVLMDISFQSISRVFADLPWSAFAPNCKFVFLLKPQFELPSVDVPEGGVVLSESSHKKAIDIVRRTFLERSIDIQDVTASPVLGRTGNQEFFLYAEFA